MRTYFMAIQFEKIYLHQCSLPQGAEKTKSHLLIFVINIKLITESITFKDKIVFVHQEYR